MNGGYGNFNMEGSNSMTTFGENYEQLQKIKLKYDPNNMFKYNHNVEPFIPK